MSHAVATIADGLRIAYREGTVDEEVIGHGFAVGDWSRREYQPEPDHVILDVGAHIGTFALRAATRVPEGRVLAVEAARDSYDLLVENVALNDLRNVQAHHLALTAERGVVPLHHADENWSHTITAAMPDAGETVPAMPLGDYLRENDVDRCHFAKLNCEGAEFPLLMAASVEDLRRFDRMLVFYHLDLVEDRYDLESLEGHLRSAGFEIRRGGHDNAQRGRLTAWRPEGAGT